MPFSGGKRICLGKTFAEINLRLIAIYLTELFDFDFKDKKRFEGLNNYPEATAL